MPSNLTDLRTLESRLGYTFTKQTLLETALTHTSLPPKDEPNQHHNQRLEFLGDAILSMVLAEYLYHSLPEQREGYLTHARAALANGSFLADLARKLTIPDYLLLSEAAYHAKNHMLDSVLEDALEAVIGAVYLDSDFATTSKVVISWYVDIDEQLKNQLKQHNPKGRLQEYVQQQSGNNLLEYETIEESGPSHCKVFTIQIRINGKPIGQAGGNSKKEAEEKAAEIAICKLNIE